MEVSNLPIKRFQLLDDALAFISDCVEADNPSMLFRNTSVAEKQDERYVERPEHFAAWTFPPLREQAQVMDFRIRYKERSFPAERSALTLGGHGSELGHMHIEFERRPDGWVISRIWQCR